MGGEIVTAVSEFRGLCGTRDLGDDVTLLLGRWNHSDVPSYMLADLTDDLGKEFKKLVTSFTKTWQEAMNRSAFDLIPYDPQYIPEPHEVLWIEAAKGEKRLRIIMDGIPEASDARPLVSDEDLPGTGFFVLTVEDATGTSIRCLRMLTPSKKLTRGVLARLIGRRFSRIEEPSLIFEPGFQVIIYKGFLFIFSKGGFETLFRYYEEAKTQAVKMLEKINRVIPIANSEKLQARMADNVRMARRLLIIGTSPVLKDLKIPKLKKTITDFGLSINIVKKDGKEALEYDDTRPYELLKLLEDQIVDSHTTGHSYEANSKREITRVKK
jgi:hypothetical protein